MLFFYHFWYLNKVLERKSMKWTQDILVLVYLYNIHLTSTIILIRNVTIIIILDIITIYNYNYKSNQCNLQANKDFGAAQSFPQEDTTCICTHSVVQMVWKFGFQKAVLGSKIVFFHLKRKKKRCLREPAGELLIHEAGISLSIYWVPGTMLGTGTQK